MRALRLLFRCLGLLVFLPTAAPAETAPAPFEIRAGDRVLFLGDALLEREGTYGYLETRMHEQFAARPFTVRNLSRAGDTPLGVARAGFDPPAAGFARLKEQIARVRPTVVFLGYGLAASLQQLTEESHDPTLNADPARYGAEPMTAARFKQELGTLMEAIEGKAKGEGRKAMAGEPPPASTPSPFAFRPSPFPIRFVLLSPIRHEDLRGGGKDEGGRMKDEGKHAAAPTGHAPSPATGGQTPSSFIPHPSSFSPSSGYTTRALPDLVRTDDVSFRPIDVKLGPDGALYVADWSDPVIHHSEGDVRDPRRDHHSGRIWRISKKGAAVVQWEPLVGKTKRELLTTLVRTDSLWEKEQSRRIVQVRNWRSSADDEGKLPAELAEVGGLEFARILQADQSVDPSRLGKLLSAKEPNVRAAVLRIIGPWYPGIVEMYKGRAKREEDKLKDAPMPGDRWFLSEGDPIVRADNFPNDEPDRSRALVKYWDDFQPFARAIADPNPRVRLEAMRALARIPTARSAELVLDAAMKAPADDVYYRHAAWLSINELAKPWTEAIASGKWKAAGREAQLAFGLKALPPDLARDTLARVLADGKADLATGPWIDLIGHCGGPDDLRRLYEMLLVSYGTDCCPDPAVEALQAAPVNDATALRILAALLDSARLRDVRPSGNLATLERLVLQTKDAVRADSVRLVGYWKPAGALRWLETALADGQAPLNPAGVANAIASVREVGGAPAIALLKKLAADSPPARAALLRAALEAGDVREEK